MNNKWVSHSPHIYSGLSTTRIFISMMVFLVPVVAGAFISSGFNVLYLIGISVLSALGTDLIFNLIVNKKYDFSEISSVFIGLVIGLSMPTGASWWVPIAGTVFAVLFIRNIAGGIGQNFVSEIAVAVLLTSLMFSENFYLYQTTEGFTSVSFLDKILAGEITTINFEALLFGGIAGSIGETAGLWLIVAGVLAICFRRVDFRVPLVILISTFVFGVLFFDVITAVNLLFTGYILLTAFFVATDYAIVPKNKYMKYVYGVLIGLVTILIIKYGNANMASIYSVIVVGLMSSMFNNVTRSIKK